MQNVSDELLRTLTKFLPQENILENEPMDTHTTFRVGGAARYLLNIDNSEQLSGIVRYLNLVGREYFLIGNGSNLLVSDKGYDGIVLKLSGSFKDIRVEGDRVICGGGALLSAVARAAADNSLTGMEFAAGIPGSLGGAMVMNAGAFDGEMGMITESVTVINKKGEELVLDNSTMEFGYRRSVLRGTGYIATQAELRLKTGIRSEIEALMAELNGRRRQRQPLEYPSAGSTFKRPEGYYAGKLIMDAGLRGFSIGGAMVSDKHCGFVINRGNASASDVRDVIVQVQEVVREKFGVELEREVILLGDF